MRIDEIGFEVFLFDVCCVFVGDVWINVVVEYDFEGDFV